MCSPTMDAGLRSPTRNRKKKKKKGRPKFVPNKIDLYMCVRAKQSQRRMRRERWALEMADEKDGGNGRKSGEESGGLGFV